MFETLRTVGAEIDSAVEKTQHTLTAHPFLFAFGILLVALTYTAPSFRVLSGPLNAILFTNATGALKTTGIDVIKLLAVGLATGGTYAILYPILTTLENTDMSRSYAITALKTHAPNLIPLGIAIALLTILSQLILALTLTTGLLTLETLASLTTELTAGQTIPLPSGTFLGTLIFVHITTLTITAPLFFLYPMVYLDTNISRSLRSIPVLTATHAYNNKLTVLAGATLFFFPEVLIEIIEFSQIRTGTPIWLTITLLLTGALKTVSLVFLYHWYTDTIQPSMERTHNTTPAFFTRHTVKVAAAGAVVFMLVFASVGAVRVADPDFNQPTIEQQPEFGANATAADAYTNRIGYAERNRGIQSYKETQYHSENTFKTPHSDSGNEDYYNKYQFQADFVDDANEQTLIVRQGEITHLGENPPTRPPYQLSQITYVGSDGSYTHDGRSPLASISSDTTNSQNVSTWHFPHQNASLQYYNPRVYSAENALLASPGSEGGAYQGRAFTADRWTRTSENNTHVVFKTNSVAAAETRMDTNLVSEAPWEYEDHWKPVVDARQQSESATGTIVVNKSNGMPVKATYTYNATYELRVLDTVNGQEMHVTRPLTETQTQKYRYSYGEPVPVPEIEGSTLRRVLIDAATLSD